MGAQLNLPDIDWSHNGVNLVLALSTDCHYCRESAPFYRNLVGSGTGDTFHTLAIFPQSTLESREYLRLQGIVVQEVRQANLSSLGVTGTPTLILVDNSGRVKSEWIGKLSPEQEGQVYRNLGTRRASNPENISPKLASHVPPAGAQTEEPSAITPIELKRMMANSPNLPILDIRDRDQFSVDRIFGALNIPIDELETRAVHESPITSTILLYCNFTAACQAHANGTGNPIICSEGSLMLHDAGFEHVRLITSDLQAIKSVGIPVAANASGKGRKSSSASTQGGAGARDNR